MTEETRRDEIREEVKQVTSEEEAAESKESPLLVKTVVLYENERFQLSSFGWSKNGLLPTDRRHISTRNGKQGWSSLEEADAAMISHGWTWTQNEWDIQLDDSLPHQSFYSVGGSTDLNTNKNGIQEASKAKIDSEGWTYATNFSSIDTNGAAVKAMTHFVRRRRRTRQQSYIGPSIANATCDHCDSQKVKDLSDSLLEVLAQTSLYENPGDYSEVETNRLKNKLHDLLGISTHSKTVQDMESAQKCIDKFFISVINSKSAWSKLSSIVGADYLPEKLPERALQVSNLSFPPEERVQLACMIIRKYDSSFSFHCSQRQCGEACSFALMSCPNLGCSEMMSAKYIGDHLEVCPYTRQHCERNCGAVVARKEMSYHLKADCELRPAICPYASLGCKEEQLSVRSLTAHLKDADAINSHLLLSLTRLEEQQGVIVKLHKKVKALESTVEDQALSISALQGGATAAMVAIKKTEQDVERTSHQEVKDLEKKLDSSNKAFEKKVDSLSKTIRTLEKENSAQKAQLANLKQKERTDTE